VHEQVVALTLDEAPGRVAFITDSMAAAGSADGDYRLGELNVTVRDGLALLSGTETIAGSTLTLDAALRRAVDVVGLPWPDAVAAVTAVPARALGFGDWLGRLRGRRRRPRRRRRRHRRVGRGHPHPLRVRESTYFWGDTPCRGPKSTYSRGRPGQRAQSGRLSQA
jgi:hypothetical protein